MANSQNLEDMKLPELKELAKQMGLRGTSTMRKPELLATLQAARNGGEPPAGVTVRAPKAAKTAKVVKAPQSDAAEANTTDNADVATQSPAPAATEPQLDLPLPVADDAKKDETEPRRTRRKAADDAASEPRAARHRRDDDQSDFARRKPRKKADEAGDLLATLDLGDAAPTERRRERHEDVEVPLIRRVRDDEDEQPRRRRRTAENSEETVRDLDDILAMLPTQKHEETSEDGEQNDEHEFVRRNRRDRSDRNDRDNRNDRNDRRNRRMRGRDRDNADDDRRYDDRDNRSDRNDRDSRREEPQEDLVPVAGIVDVLDSYAFVRTSGYLPGPNDVYVSMGQVKKYGLRKGDAVHGSIRAPREGDRRNQRQKFVPLQAIDSINGQSVEEALNRPQFSKLTPLYPQERLKQETAPNKLTGRIMDIVSPIGKGQRGLIVSPPKAGKTITLQNIANSIAANNPEVHLMVVLVDERPEEVTDMERTVQG
uniref:Rho termination factor N-terminal domain-containing protein n=1 Tax=Bifidobacterium longum TaxID=216816 RepID=UPI00319E3B2F